MNVNNLHQIFDHYIEQFERLNNTKHAEYYKWEIAGRFHTLMDNALASEDEVFASMLNKASRVTQNMIDSHIQPFNGLVRCARTEPVFVRQMFIDLYKNDGNDLKIREEKISDFFARSQELMDRQFPGSFRFKQDAHAVSSYLFLYDPDNHYMYKATQSRAFADCIEYYNGWGTGNEIRLKDYYQMCDWAVEQIKNNSAILDTDRARLEYFKDEMYHSDTNKHILLFDLIYCCSVYGLFKGISYSSPKPSQRSEILSRKQKAKELYEEYRKAFDDKILLEQSKEKMQSILSSGAVVTHRTLGSGTILTCSETGTVKIEFTSGQVKSFGAAVIFKNRLIKLMDPINNEAVLTALNILERKNSIDMALSLAEKNILPYREYLDE